MIRWILVTGVLMVFAVGLLAVESARAHDLSISIGTPPELMVVPGTPVYYAPALPNNYFVYGGRYYVFQNGGWFYAPAYDGPWTIISVKKVPKPVLAVPVEYYKVPPGHWKKGGPPPWAGHGKGPKPKKEKED